MSFDWSVIFIVILIVGCFGVIAWAEIHTRRNHKTAAPSAENSMLALPDEPAPPPTRRTRRS